MTRNVGYLCRIISDNLMKMNWFIFTVPKIAKLELPSFRKWEIHPGYGENLCVKKKKKNPSQQHWVAQPLDLVFLHALHCILSKTSNRELVWATFPHPQALNGREWQGVKKKRSMYSGNWKLIHNTYAPTHSKKWTDTVNQLQLMLTFHNFW